MTAKTTKPENKKLQWIITIIITLTLSIGGGLLSASYKTGETNNRIINLESCAKDAQSKYQELKDKYEKDHDLLIRIDEKLDNILELEEKTSSRLDNHIGK